MGEVIHVQFGARWVPPVPSDADHMLTFLAEQLDPEDFDDLMRAVSDWHHYQTCDQVIQDLAFTYLRYTNQI